MYLHCCCGSASSKFVTVLSFEMKHPYSGCPIVAFINNDLQKKVQRYIPLFIISKKLVALGRLVVINK